MLGCISSPENPMILVEYCAYGDLLRFLRNHREFVLMLQDDVCPIDADMCLRIKDLVSIAWQVSDGLTYLSSKNFIHRDVAARNVLITKHLVAKVSDFGLGRYADSALYTARGGRLPFKSMALEALKFYEFSEKTDVSDGHSAFCSSRSFSLGDVPYSTVQPMDMISYIEQGNRPPQPEKCPDEIYKLMTRCWKADPNDRPTFAEIRGELTILLNIDDESYGYLNLNPDKKSRQNS
ncbi:protein tyrosine kinase [Cooperia oncophora]